VYFFVAAGSEILFAPTPPLVLGILMKAVAMERDVHEFRAHTHAAVFFSFQKSRVTQEAGIFCPTACPI
jgi:hypothetical protein